MTRDAKVYSSTLMYDILREYFFLHVLEQDLKQRAFIEIEDAGKERRNA